MPRVTASGNALRDRQLHRALGLSARLLKREGRWGRGGGRKGGQGGGRERRYVPQLNWLPERYRNLAASFTSCNRGWRKEEEEEENKQLKDQTNIDEYSRLTRRLRLPPPLLPSLLHIYPYLSYLIKSRENVISELNLGDCCLPQRGVPDPKAGDTLRGREEGGRKREREGVRGSCSSSQSNTPKHSLLARTMVY